MLAFCQLGEPAKEAIKKRGNRCWADAATRWLNPAVEAESTRLVSAAAPRAATPFAKAIPVIGAVVSGAVDMTTVIAMGVTAKAVFRRGERISSQVVSQSP